MAMESLCLYSTKKQDEKTPALSRFGHRHLRSDSAGWASTSNPPGRRENDISPPSGMGLVPCNCFLGTKSGSGPDFKFLKALDGILILRP